MKATAYRSELCAGLSDGEARSDLHERLIQIARIRRKEYESSSDDETDC